MVQLEGIVVTILGVFTSNIKAQCGFINCDIIETQSVKYYKNGVQKQGDLCQLAQKSCGDSELEISFGSLIKNELITDRTILCDRRTSRRACRRAKVCVLWNNRPKCFGESTGDASGNMFWILTGIFLLWMFIYYIWKKTCQARCQMYCKYAEPKEDTEQEPSLSINSLPRVAVTEQEPSNAQQLSTNPLHPIIDTKRISESTKLESQSSHRETSIIDDMTEVKRNSELLGKLNSQYSQREDSLIEVVSPRLSHEGILKRNSELDKLNSQFSHREGSIIEVENVASKNSWQSPQSSQREALLISRRKSSIKDDILEIRRNPDLTKLNSQFSFLEGSIAEVDTVEGKNSWQSQTEDPLDSQPSQPEESIQAMVSLTERPRSVRFK